MLPRLLAVLVVASATAATGCSSSGSGSLPGTQPPVPVADGGVFTTFDTIQSDTTPTPDGTVQPGPDVDNGLTGCTTNVDCPATEPFCGVTKFCFECLETSHCPTGATCNNGACISATCTPGETRCNGNTVLTCNASGSAWDPFFCVGGQCVQGVCQGCSAGQRVCKGDEAVMECLPDGSTFQEVQVCGAEQVCAQGECKTCFPGNRRCVGQVAEECNLDGEWQLTQDCAAQGQSCSAGACVSACSADIKFKSNSGCDYWAVDLDNLYSAQDGPFAVIVSNLSESQATVTITAKDDPATSPAQVANADVAPGQLHVFNLPQRHIGGAAIGWNAYRIQATSPIIAYQFNPLDNVDVFSNDASLLIPGNTYGTEYVAISRAQFWGGGPEPVGLQSCQSVCGTVAGGQCIDDGSGLGTQACVVPYRGTLTVVAPAADTVVSITPTTRTLAGPGVQAMVAGNTYTFTLQPFQILNIKSDEDGGDLTGTRVVSDGKPIAVFSGHEASVTGQKCCADHLEQQLFPVNTWGKEYLATKAFPRGIESDYWRFMAAEDGTTLTFEPASVSAPRSIDRGEFVEIATKADFKVSSDKPFSVAQFLASSQEILLKEQYESCTSDNDCHPGYICGNSLIGLICFPPECPTAGISAGCPGGHTCAQLDATTRLCQAIGDPALISMAPTEQFRAEYVFLVPGKYQDDYINVVAPNEAVVSVDSFTLPAGNFEAIPGTGYKVARLQVEDGVHRVTSTLPVGVVVYGFDKDVSYGYTAGLNLSDL